jgi:uncharacterized protein
MIWTVCLASFLASALTLFSGFGLGTLLMPVFALFFPLDAAIAMTAAVHLLNNLFKLALYGRFADRAVLTGFGIPALFSAFLGAWALIWFSGLPPLFQYEIAGRSAAVTPVKITVALLMLMAAGLEVLPRFRSFSFDKRHWPLGGFLSGFFGGLSGHQGAFRSIFLVRSGLTPQGFIGTGVAIACLVDLARISVYGAHFQEEGLRTNFSLVALASAAAFCGVGLGNFGVKKITIKALQGVVAMLLVLIAALLGSGIL